jgi:hypothetical protein
MVKAHQRADPRCGGAELEPPVVAVATRRRDPSDPLRPVPLEGGPGGGGRAQRSPPSAQAPAAGPVAPDAVRRHLLSILAPGGQPIGAMRPRSSRYYRGMPGGEAAARALFARLIAGVPVRDVTPPGHGGRLLLLPDGSRLGFRPTSSSGTPAIDIDVPGLRVMRRIHFHP